MPHTPRMRHGLRQRSEGTWQYYILVPDPLTGTSTKRWRTARGRYEEVKARRLHEQAEALEQPIRRTVAEQWRYWCEEVCIFRHAYQSGLIARCPTDNGAVIPPRATPYEGHYWTAEQARVALNDLRDAGLYLPVRLALQAGLRVGEIAGLSAEHVDLDAPSIRVRWTVRGFAQSIELVALNTPRSGRVVPICRGLAECLRPLVESALRRPPTFIGTPGTPLHLLFGNPDGSPRTSTWMAHRFAAWCTRRAAELGLPWIRFWDLRTSFAIMLLEQGESISVVAQRLGHTRVEMTAYTLRMVRHPSDAVARALAELDVVDRGSSR